MPSSDKNNGNTTISDFLLTGRYYLDLQRISAVLFMTCKSHILHLLSWIILYLCIASLWGSKHCIVFQKTPPLMIPSSILVDFFIRLRGLLCTLNLDYWLPGLSNTTWYHLLIEKLCYKRHFKSHLWHTELLVEPLVSCASAESKWSIWFSL